MLKTVRERILKNLNELGKYGNEKCDKVDFGEIKISIIRRLRKTSLIFF